MAWHDIRLASKPCALRKSTTLDWLPFGARSNAWELHCSCWGYMVFSNIWQGTMCSNAPDDSRGRFKDGNRARYRIARG
jgi:hypothetical protein